MNKRLILASIAGLLAIGLMASPAFAQRGGRGGWGGGGRSYGGFGGYGGGYGGYGRGYGNWGGYGNNWGGYGNNWYGGYGRGYGIGIGLGFGSPYYGNYYNNGGYYSNGYYGTPNSYAYGTYVDQQPIISSDLSNYQVQMNSEPTGSSVAMQSFYSGPSNSAGSAQLSVKVPADAQVWLGNMESGQQGTDRQFSFPALPAGDNMFTLHATWNENGQTVTRDRQVNVKAGANATVDLTKASSDNPASTNSNNNNNSNVGHPADTNTSGQKTTAPAKTTPPTRPNTGTDQ